MIEVKGLCKSFGGTPVLENVDLTVEEGERIAIIGGSGCGKSVFLRCLELLEKPDAGQIFIGGQEITARGADVDSIRRSMGMVYQRFNLFSEMNVMDNLCLAPVRLLHMPRKEAEKRAMELLAQVGLASRARDWPGVLSGGQQQRIAICRSLMMEPKVMLFDEPTSALDPSMVGEVLAVIRMLSRRKLTMLIVTHEMSFAREVADRVLFFAEGGIHEQGTPEEVFDRPQREKTIAFIRKIKYFQFDIAGRDFDLMAMQGGLAAFAEKYGISSSRRYQLQLYCEELAYEFLNHCWPNGGPADLHIEVSWAEGDQAAVVELRCGGEAYNPLEESDNDFALAILQQTASKLEYRFENGENRITAIL